MDLVKVLDSVFNAIPNFPTQEVISVVIAYSAIRALVSIGAQEERYRMIETRKFPYLPNFVQIWRWINGVILAYHLIQRLFDLDIQEMASAVIDYITHFAPKWIINIFQTEIIQILIKCFFPLPDAVISAVSDQFAFFLVLISIFLLEVIAHKGLRQKIKEVISSTWKNLRSRANQYPDRLKKKEVAKNAAAVNSVWEDAANGAGEKIREHIDESQNEERRKPTCRSILYEYDDDLSRCFLKEEYKWQRIFFQATIILLLTFYFSYEKEGNTAGVILFPLFTLTECWIQSAVPTRREVFEKAQKQNGIEQRKKHLSEVIDTISKGENSGSTVLPQTRVVIWNNDRTYMHKAYGDAEELTQEEVLIDQYLRMCKAIGESADPFLEMPAKALLKGKSVVFSTRFYQDVDYSFHLPMLRILQKGYHCLVVSGNQMDVKPLKDWLLNGKRHVIGDTAIWRMERLGLVGKQQHTDIGYMTAEDIGNEKLVQENLSFLSRVRLVLIVNASALLHKQLFGIMCLRSSLHEDCTFAICNDNAVGLTDIYSHLLRTELCKSHDNARETQLLHVS